MNLTPEQKIVGQENFQNVIGHNWRDFLKGAVAAKTVTYDLERQMEGATLLKCSEFGQAIIDQM